MTRLSRAQARQIDRVAIEEYGIPGIVLMENAARAVVQAATEMLEQANGHTILILCGTGNNGGDGLAAARHLHNRQMLVKLLLLGKPEKYKGDAQVNWKIARAMNIAWEPANVQKIAAAKSDLIIDAMFGTGLTEAPREPFPEIAAAVNATQIPVLAVDLPSGLDCDTGQPLGTCIRAAQTVTFVAEKLGFALPDAKAYLGRVTIGDIGCPRQCIEKVLHSLP